MDATSGTVDNANDSAVSLRSQLVRSEAYAQDVVGTQPVSLIETHISWVFLLERDVFKVKKPVDLGFLDFRSALQRRKVCEAEVALNRRLAPDVYFGVVPVRRDGAGRAYIDELRAQASESHEIVDWAVHMRRLPDGARADNLLANGALDRDAIDAIAARLCAFHEKTEPLSGARYFGSPEVITRNVEENFDYTNSRIEQYVTREEAKELRDWQRLFLSEYAERFEQRANEGRVRDGHGDLRLEHVYIEDNRVVVLDCIEFNERFRFGDRCADIAFLSMDLAHHGRVDLAERFLSSYARLSNDFDLYGVVDFYESYRAHVRAKIAVMVAEDASIDSGTRKRAAEQARKYFLLALSAHRRSALQPMVVAVGGTIASGKSTIADLIGDEMSAPVVESDRTRKSMLGVGATAKVHEAAWAGAYDPAFTQVVYDEVLRRAESVLASGRPVIIDASFRSASMRSAARELAVRHNVPFRFVECRATAEVCKARLAIRKTQRVVSDGRLEIFDAFSAQFEPVSELAEGEHIVIDTTRSVEESIKNISSVVNTWPRGLGG